MLDKLYLPKVIYLDNAATTQCDQRVIDEMNIYQNKLFGNPSSLHTLGKLAAFKLEECREQIQDNVGALHGNLYFTSGATESNNLAVLSLLRHTREVRNRTKVLCLCTEHKSVLNALRYFGGLLGIEIVSLPVLSNGRIDMDYFVSRLTSDVGGVVVQMANSETGVTQDIRVIASQAHDMGAAVFSDVTQVIGKLPINLGELNVDFASLSAHKFYGPKGVGALWVREGYGVAPLVFGGGQEKDVRPGTQNLPGVVGMTLALTIVTQEIASNTKVLTLLRDKLWENIKLLNGVTWNGQNASLLPSHLNITIDGVYAQDLMLRSRGIALSAGSACNSATNTPSPVLIHMGLSPTQADQTIRLTVGLRNTISEIVEAADILVDNIRNIRSGA